MNHNWTLIENERIGEKYYYLRHKSGLPIYVFPKKMASAYAILATRFGSVNNTFRTDENEDFMTVPDGVAHFLEHKMFENEDGIDTFAHFSENGANANAYTSNEKTAYLFSATDRFYDSLRVLLDFVGHPYFTDENVKKEQGIIAQEIGMYDDHPGARLYYAMLENLYQTHPIRLNVAGTVESIAKITPDILYRSYYAFYNLNNMALVIAGDVDPEGVEEVADAVLQGASSFRIEQPTVLEQDGVSASKKVIKMDVSRPQFAIGIKDVDLPADPYEKARRALAMDILNDLLFGRSTEFYGELYEKGLLQDDFTSEYEWYSNCAYNAISGESDDPDAVYEAILTHLEKMMQSPPSKADFERLRRCNYADYIRGFDSTEEIANSFLHYLFLDVDYLRIGDLIAELTYEEVVELMREFYHADRFTLAVVAPLNES